MSVTARELWTVLHGLVFGSLFLLAFGGGLAGLYSLRPQWVTVDGIRERTRRLIDGTWLMAVMAWFTVLSGTYIVYPWYRAKPPAGADLTQYPRYLLLSKPTTAEWHKFGMEWKEHIAWFAPILATAVAFAVIYYREDFAREDKVRRAILGFFIVAFCAAGIAGLFGAFINKVAPIR